MLLTAKIFPYLTVGEGITLYVEPMMSQMWFGSFPPSFLQLSSFFCFSTSGCLLLLDAFALKPFSSLVKLLHLIKTVFILCCRLSWPCCTCLSNKYVLKSCGSHSLYNNDAVLFLWSWLFILTLKNEIKLTSNQWPLFFCVRLLHRPLHCHIPFLCWTPWLTYLCTGLSCAVSAHKLHKLLKRVLVVMVAYGGVGEVRAGLLDDRGGGEVQGWGWGTGTPWGEKWKVGQETEEEDRCKEKIQERPKTVKLSWDSDHCILKQNKHTQHP